MSEIKLFVTHTPNRNTVRIEHPLMYNVIAGSAFLTQSVPEGMLWIMRGTIFHLRTNLIVN
mgnify:CR=1 FL=1